MSSALRARHIPEQAMMIVTADHGEGRDVPPALFMTHATTIKDDQIRIPLYMHIPGVAAERTIRDQVSQTDIMPTILDVLGLLNERTAPRSGCDGRSLLPLLHGQTLPERAVYAEISKSYLDAGGVVDVALRVPLIRYRALRYPDRKYLLVGKHIEITDELLGAPAESFFLFLVRDILGRRETQPDTDQWLPLIQAVPSSDLAGRRALLRRFEESGEFEHTPRYAIYNLQRDPLEVKPTDARRNPHDWQEYQAELDAILAIEREGRPGGPLMTNEADEVVILKRLQDLGYVE
jgi:hypothetical protein